MINKSLYSSMLKFLAIFSWAFILISCSSSSQDQWPELRADGLWQDLSQVQNETLIEPEDDQGTDIRQEIPAPPFATPTLSLLDIQVALSEIDRDFSFNQKNMARALSQYEEASITDKSSNWRAVEIQKSRLNDIVVKLRSIEYQIVDNPEATSELSLTRKLIHQIVVIIPIPPD